ncbi:MAG: SdiA-regulated domain-containing protein [Bacteroidia bacterium]
MKYRKFWFIPTFLLVVIFPLHYLSFEAKKPPVFVAAHYTLFACSKGYDFSAPNEVFTLETILQEISGISYLSAEQMACVQDEVGMVFLLNLKTGKIKNSVHFANPNDYEGLAKVNDSTLYVLQSEGNLFEVKYFSNEKHPEIQSFKLNLLTKDNEGLCYDAQNQRLLIAAKSTMPQFKDLRLVYAFDLKTKTIDQKPIMHLDMKELELAWNKLKMKAKDSVMQNAPFDFRTSEMAIHPLTKDIYFLSAQTHLLAILNAKGKFQELSFLNPDWFNQPEGMTFAPNGDLYIANEGGVGEPTLLKFNYKPFKTKAVISGFK